LKKVTKINVTVKCVSHPDPKRLTDVWARMVLKEIYKQEAEDAVHPVGSTH